MYKSQYGQDKYIDKLFEQKEGGVFLDIGAHDGEFLSNTYFLEKHRDWTGMCFEPNPRLFANLVKIRNCICIEGAASDVEGEFDFLDIEGVEALGGLVSKYDERHLDRIDHDFEMYKGKGREVIKVSCYNVNKLLLENNIKHVDYCSIDTEGGELDIVKSIDLAKIFIAVFTIENNYQEKNKVKKFLRDLRKKTVNGYLRSKGYKLIDSLNCDEVFIHHSMISKLPESFLHGRSQN